MIGYFEGPLGSGKTSRLLAQANQLLDTVPAASILILCSNHNRQAAFIEKLLAKRSTPLAELPVYTYAGFVRNALFNYWPLAEAEIAATLKQGACAIRPELSGMEDSELVLRWLLAQLRREAADSGGEPPYANFPGSDRHILKQIIRRLRLRSENQLSRKDMSDRSALLNEPCRPETAWLENRFDRVSYGLRTLDASKQLDVFHRLFTKDNVLSQQLKGGIKHLLVDDVDETIAAQQRFIEWLAPSLKTLILTADIDGGSRRGYLNAYPYDWQALKRLKPGETTVFTRKDAFYEAGQTLLSNWKNPEPFAPLPAVVQRFDDFITRVDMLERVVEDILALLENGANPGDFCLVLPKTDPLTVHRLANRLRRYGLPVQLLSGTKRPSDTPHCRGFIHLLQWARSRAWQSPLSPWEIKTVLTHVLRAHHWPEFTEADLDALVQAVHAHHRTLPETGLLPALDSLPVTLSTPAVDAYVRLGNWLEKAIVLPFDQLLYSAFTNLIAVFSDEQSAYGDLNRIIQSYLRQQGIYNGLESGLNISPSQTGHKPVSHGHFERWWLAQVKTGSVADTPDVAEAVQSDSLIIGTPQKIIDVEAYRPIQCWLDIGSREWARSDNAPLYNAWVHSAVWDGSDTAFSEEFNEAVIRTRAGHITRTLMLLATKQIRVYGSELDDLGFEQSNLLTPRLTATLEDTGAKQLERATLRPDQAPILAYRQGTMAISAVPGAGKTFVNVELLLELIESGVEPDRILVLTYMDSAAKTLLSRLKKKLTGITTKLPVVSTIHSLALRILTENDQALLVGALPEDMTLLDEYAKGEILSRIAAGTLPESARSVGDWQRAVERGIGHAKMFGLTAEIIRHQHKAMPECFRLVEFLPALQAYDEMLRQSGSVDFTDLILKAVRILSDYPDIREKYRKRFTYIIEDEAQDSSRLLQTFISLLGGESPNLIRTGDTNQSITTTFSSAEPAVFRDFIRNAQQVVTMDRSGRCAQEVMTLANFWMEAAAQQPGLGDAFEPVKMLAVADRNPSLFEPIQAQCFETARLEESWLIDRIGGFRYERPEASIAVLVRNNFEVNRITSQLQGAGIQAVGVNDSINAQPVFKGILSCLKLLAEPGSLAIQAEWRQWMTEAGLLPEELGDTAPIPEAASNATFTEVENETSLEELLSEEPLPTRVSIREWLDTSPLLYAQPASIPHEALRQWHYDLLEFSNQAAGANIGALVARIAERLCPEAADRSNGYLCALMAAEILEEHRQSNAPSHWQGNPVAADDWPSESPLETVIRRFEAFQRSWRGRKGFGELLSRQGSHVVQVMTLHKAKGQEFDIVFMPGLQADAFPHDSTAIRFDESDKLVRDLDRVVARENNIAFSAAYENQKRQEKIEEEARLVYVGLTRARCALFLSAHRQTLKYGKAKMTQPALAFQLLSAYLNKPANDAIASNIDQPSPQGQEV